MERASKQRVTSLLAAAAAGALAVPQSTQAGTSTWTGGGTTTAATLNTGNPSQVSVNYLTWDAVDAANWGGVTPYAIGDTAVFNAASGTFVIRPAANTLDPASMTFDGGATYDFLRASTTAGSGSSWAQNNTAGLFGADSFGSPAPYGAANNTSFSTASTFTGTVILRQRATANPGWTGTINLAGGRVEIQDVGALPATNTNTPAVTLSGGELAVNVSGNPLAYTYRLSGQNIAPGSGNMAALLNVSASSKLSNSAVDFYGRAREQNSLWNGSITIASGTVLTFNTGGGTSIGGNVSGAVWGGTGTLRLGTAAANNSGANRLRLAGNLATGANSITFDLGTSGTLDTNVATGGTGNLGSLVSGTGTFLMGSSNAGGNTDAASATPATSSSTWSIGSTGASQTIDGIIGNGVATSTGSGFPLAARSVTNTNLTKVGAGTMTLNGANVHNGANTIAANGGKIVLGNQHALGDGRELVTVNSGGTLDLNGQSQVAGKMYSLNGGSLLNDNASVSATLSSGASVSLRANTGASGNGGTGAWKGGDGTTLNQNTNAVPSVTVSAPNVGSNQATAHVLLQLGYLRGNSDGAAVGSGYTSEPKISFSAPDLAGGRPIKAVAFINASGQVAGVTIIDPGFGYTKMPTITIDDTGTGGSGFKPTWYMTAGAVLMDNGGAGYTSAPTFTIGGAGYLASSSNALGGFGSVALAATSNIGGAGNLVVDAVASGVGGLNKIGAGTVFLNAVNTYGGLTDVQAGTLGGTGSITGNLQVGVAGKIAPGASIESFGVGGNADIDGTLVVEYDGSGAGSIDLLDVLGSLEITAATVDFNQLGAALNDPAYVFASYGSLPVEPFANVIDLPAGYQIDYHYNDGFDTKNIALVAVPEPAGVGALAAVGVALAARRRRRV